MHKAAVNKHIFVCRAIPACVSISGSFAFIVSIVDARTDIAETPKGCQLRHMETQTQTS